MAKDTLIQSIKDNGLTVAIGTIVSGLIIAAWKTFKRAMTSEAAVKQMTAQFHKGLEDLQHTMQQQEIRQKDLWDDDRSELSKQMEMVHQDLRELRNYIMQGQGRRE